MSQGAKGYMGRSMRSLSCHITRFVGVSDYVQNLVRSYGVAPEKLCRIYNGTNTDVQKEFPSSLRKELRIDLDTPVVGTTGIWRPNKGFPYFIAAGEILIQWHPMVKFLLGGRAYGADSAYAANLWVRARVLRAINALEFTGYIEDVGRFMSALDIFVLPSDCEPFGLVLIEAMARGVPVIATRAGGAPEVVVHGVTGLLIPPRDPVILAEAINDLLCHPHKRMQMGEAARLHVRKHFDRRRMVKEYQDLYLQLVHK